MCTYKIQEDVECEADVYESHLDGISHDAVVVRCSCIEGDGSTTFPSHLPFQLHGGLSNPLSC